MVSGLDFLMTLTNPEINFVLVFVVVTLARAWARILIDGSSTVVASASDRLV